MECRPTNGVCRLSTTSHWRHPVKLSPSQGRIGQERPCAPTLTHRRRLGEPQVFVPLPHRWPGSRLCKRDPVDSRGPALLMLAVEDAPRASWRASLPAASWRASLPVWLTFDFFPVRRSREISVWPSEEGVTTLVCSAQRPPLHARQWFVGTTNALNFRQTTPRGELRLLLVVSRRRRH